MRKRISPKIYVNEFSNEQELDPKGLELLKLARKITNQAYAPYSGFNVGCALLLKNGKTVTGANQENASYPNGLCAERVAMFAASSTYPEHVITKIAISARLTSDSNHLGVTPCGACRQVMMEYQLNQSQPIEIIMEGGDGKVYHAESVDMLLPFKFSREFLK